MNDTIARYKLNNGNELRIAYDEAGWNPREEENIGTVYIVHGRYCFGDENFGNKEDYEEAYENIPADAIILPIYAYEHGGVTIRTSPYECRWDSGYVGCIWASKKETIEVFYGKETPDIEERIKRELKGEIEELDLYLRGESYCYELVEIEHCEYCDHTHTNIIEGPIGGYPRVEDVVEEFSNLNPVEVAV